MEEELNKIDPKRAKWWIWVLVTSVAIVIAIAAVYVWANKPYEKTIDSDSISFGFRAVFLLLPDRP